jgi:hypothetical protein
VSKRHLILLAILILIVGVAIGRYALRRDPPAAGSAGTSGAQDDAAQAASRAMTFTQPKASAR